MMTFAFPKTPQTCWLFDYIGLLAWQSFGDKTCQIPRQPKLSGSTIVTYVLVGTADGDVGASGGGLHTGESKGIAAIVVNSVAAISASSLSAAAVGRLAVAAAEGLGVDNDGLAGLAGLVAGSSESAGGSDEKSDDGGNLHFGCWKKGWWYWKRELSSGLV
jgi:hypothetical protein